MTNQPEGRLGLDESTRQDSAGFPTPLFLKAGIGERAMSEFRAAKGEGRLVPSDAYAIVVAYADYDPQAAVLTGQAIVGDGK
jgi:hypothetical protein